MDYSTISSIFQGRYSVSSRFISAFSTVSSKSLPKSTLHNAECFGKPPLNFGDSKIVAGKNPSY
jgi:hypothetical protein